MKKRLLEAEIVKMSKLHPTLGYRKITRKLCEAGWKVSKKVVKRVRFEEGLQVPPPKARLRRQGLSTGLPQKATQEPCLGLGLRIRLYTAWRQTASVQPHRRTYS